MIDEKRIADFFAELVSIDSPSLEEREMADTLKIKFAEIGVTFTEDHTQESRFLQLFDNISQCNFPNADIFTEFFIILHLTAQSGQFSI